MNEPHCKIGKIKLNNGLILHKFPEVDNVDQTMVDHLVEILRKVRAGELTSLILSCTTSNDEIISMWSQTAVNDMARSLGMLEMLSEDLHARVRGQ